jgi:hypothetical protein
VLAHAQAELEGARHEYARLVEQAYQAATRGEEASHAPIVQALHRVEQKVRAPFAMLVCLPLLCPSKWEGGEGEGEGARR